MNEIFSRTEMLVGSEALERLKNAHIAVFGMGGVGSYTAEALVRSGIGELTAVDNDTVSESNINRQLLALSSTVGRLKTDVAAERYADINPALKIHKKNVFFSAESLGEFNFTDYDFVVDAIDTVTSKLLIIRECTDKNIPVISSMGTGNKLDPSLFEITDIYKTSVCPLARVMRTELRRAGVKSLTVLASTEKPSRVCAGTEQPTDGRRSIPASIAFVPSVAGLMIAGEVVRRIIEKNS